MKRRRLLKTVGGIGAATTLTGAGLFASTIPVAAQSSISIDPGSVNLEVDDGEVGRVLIDPMFEVTWENFDDAVGAVFVVIEAKTESMETWYPVYRATPWLIPDNGVNGGGAVDYSPPGTTGHYRMEHPLSTLVEWAENNRGGDELSKVDDNGGIVIADAEVGRPDYQSAVGQEVTVEGTTKTITQNMLDLYLDGGSIGNTAPFIHEALGDDVFVNGLYGAAIDANQFDNQDDDSTKTTPVNLRFTVELLEMSLGAFEFITSHSISTGKSASAIRDELYGLYDESSGTWSGVDNASWLSDVHPEGVTIAVGGNGSLERWEKSRHYPPMDGEEEFPEVGTSRDYSELADVAEGHPAILSGTPTMPVSVKNEANTTGGSGDANGSATPG